MKLRNGNLNHVAVIQVLSISICLISILQANALPSAKTKRTDHAYVTLLYGDEFLLGVRVLGKSIRDSGSNKDMVVLVSDGVSNFAKNLLQADGWIVDEISLLANPNQVRPTRFWGVYTKLKIFNMTEYKKVVYLDADTIVVKNIEDLFKCGKFCANLKHSERLNSGVMVVEPSETVFSDMMSKVHTLHSYTGGDQGFLNSYYVGFASAPVFEPDSPNKLLDSRPVLEMERLSTLYNADVGLYMLANKWMVDEKELRIIHYTLGPLKPWDWWTSWLLKPVDVWQNVRKQLEESLPGTGGGKNPKDELIVKFIFILPFFAILFCCYCSLLQPREFFSSLCRSPLCENVRFLFYKIRLRGPVAYSNFPQSSALNSMQQFPYGSLSKVPVHLGGISVIICFMAALVSLGLALFVIPRQVMPWTGLLLMYEWTFTLFFLLFGGHLQLVYQWGKRTASLEGSLTNHVTSDYDSGKGQQRHASSSNVTACYYWFGMAILAIAAPSLPSIFGITALFLRLVLMVAGAIVLASFMTYAAEHLTIRSFIRGFEDRERVRNKSICCWY